MPDGYRGRQAWGKYGCVAEAAAADAEVAGAGECKHCRLRCRGGSCCPFGTGCCRHGCGGATGGRLRCCSLIGPGSSCGMCSTAAEVLAAGGGAAWGQASQSAVRSAGICQGQAETRTSSGVQCLGFNLHPRV